MASVTDQPWDGSASRWPSAVSYCTACLIDSNDGQKIKTKCSLPVREPGGAINRNACHAAAGALLGARGASFSPADKRAAAKQLVAIYRNDLKEQPPDELLALANG